MTVSTNREFICIKQKLTSQVTAEKNYNYKDLPSGMHCIVAHPVVVSDDADVSSRPLLLAEAEDPDRRGVADDSPSVEVAAESADLFCLLADPGAEDDPPCEEEGRSINQNTLIRQVIILYNH